MADHVGDEITFSTNFPLPYRVLALGGVGILGWATNLHGLHLLGIDAASALELSTRGHGPSSSLSDPVTTPLPTHNGWKLIVHSGSVYRPVYRLLAQFACVGLLSWTAFRYATGGRVDAVDVFKYIPAVTLVFVFMCLVCPLALFEKRERDKFLLCVFAFRARSTALTGTQCDTAVPHLAASHLFRGRRVRGYIHVFRKSARRRVAVGVHAVAKREPVEPPSPRRPRTMDLAYNHEVSPDPALHPPALQLRKTRRVACPTPCVSASASSSTGSPRTRANVRCTTRSSTRRPSR